MLIIYNLLFPLILLFLFQEYCGSYGAVLAGKKPFGSALECSHANVLESLEHLKM